MTKLLLVIVLFSTTFLQAQKSAAPPARLLTRFGFVQLTGGVILVQARFEGFADTLSFILDTGSGGISLDSTRAAEFRLTGAPSGRSIRGIAGIKEVSFLTNRTLHLPGLSVDSLNFHINNYELLTAVYGERIDGIIGYSFFKRYILKVNYDSTQIEVWTNGAIKYPRGGHLLKPVITTLAVQQVRVKDQQTFEPRFLIDMGAGLNLLFNRSFITDSALLRPGRVMYNKEAEGLGGKIDMVLTVIKEVKLGPYRFRNVPVNVFTDTYNVTAYPQLGGLIGNDLLRRFNVTVNYTGGEFHLYPNSHYRDGFDYAYSGLELYLLNGLIVVGDVAVASPAEKAGLLEGDVVVAVNKNFSQNLTQYKAAIGATDRWLTLIVQRGGELLNIRFKVKNILRNE